MTQRRAIRHVLGVLAGLFAAVASPATAPAQTVPASGNADALLVVDCLLPGQMRQLGGKVTYVTARRAIKTSAGDCEIRGGEYTAYDRASYATSLKVWLPLAQGGDPEAQNNVGEIFEKGLGVPPDFEAAVVWYKKSADQNYSRAAINLGGLYERGQGVPKDPGQALNWYRRATGLPELQFKVEPPAPVAPPPAPPKPTAPPKPAAALPPANPPAAPQPDPKQAAELERLRTENAALRSQLTSKQAELDRTQADRDRLQKDVAQRSTQTDAQRAELAQLRKDLEAKRKADGAQSAGVSEMERAIADREARLKAQDKEVADLKASLAQAQKTAAAQQAEVARLKQTADAKPPTIQIIEPELVATRGIKMLPVPAQAETVLVIGRVESAPGIMALTINGREEKLDNSMFRANLPIREAEERVVITAIDKNGKKATFDFVVPGKRGTGEETTSVATRAGAIGHPKPAQPLQLGTYHALLIGNNDYAFLPKLKTAINDVDEIGRILKQNYGFNVTILKNANRYQILSALNTMREKLSDKDNLLIYYGGHGELDQINQRGNWLPIDAEPKSTANWISNIAITDVLNAMSVRQLLVVADSCYSGTLTRSALGNIEGGVSSEERLKLVRAMAQQRSRMAMTAGGLEPVLDSDGGKHSAFAQVFIDALNANIGLLAGQELFSVVQGKVVSAADRLQTRQVPEYAPIKFAGHESGDFFFLRTTN